MQDCLQVMSEHDLNTQEGQAHNRLMIDIHSNDDIDLPESSERKRKIELVPAQVLIPKTTTDVDTNPVLSNISIPKQLDTATQITNDPLYNGEPNNIDKPDKNDSLLRPSIQSVESRLATRTPVNNKPNIPALVNHGSSNRVMKQHIEVSELQLETPLPLRTDTYSSNLARTPNGPALKFLDNDSKKMRSSIYESKSTAKAIPIRKSGGSIKHRIADVDDSISTRSTSSSMTASLSKSFLFGFYNTNRQKNKKQTGILSKEYWMKDESAKDCFSCGKKFNTFRRKHHCRMCGQIFCYTCTLLISGEQFGFDDKIRVCHNCSKNIENYQDSSDEEDDTSVLDKINQSGLDENIISPYIPQSTPELESEDQALANLNSQEGLQPNLEQLQKKVLLLQDDDFQSIITNGDDSRLFIQTPQPPPRMTIPATKQGESVAIAFDTTSQPLNKSLSNNSVNSANGSRDKQAIKNMEIMQLSPQYNTSHDNQITGVSPPFSSWAKKRTSMNSLRRSIFNYVSNNNGHKHTNSESNISSDTAATVIGNSDKSSFKFEFNYLPRPQRSISNNSSSDTIFQQSNGNKSDTNLNEHYLLNDDLSEDEGTMSIYSSLNDINNSDNPIRSLRNSNKSSQRAQASLERMRTRRRSRSRSKTNSNLSLTTYRSFRSFTHSSPNLISVISDDDQFKFPQTSTAANFTRNKSKNISRSVFRRLSSLSGLKNSKLNTNDLSEVALLHFNALLKQVLNDQELSNGDVWLQLLTDILAKIQGIDLSTKNFNTMDFRQTYVKIKRISGGSISDCAYINGVVFSKALPLKSMPTYVPNPRILLIMFPLEYQRNENQFLSLRNVFDQEKEYLNKLVLRLRSLSPDIIFVGANVSGYALQLLDEAGIVVQYGLKPQVIERIARLTEADIAISIDKLAANVKMGECGSFEVKSFIYGNLCRTYTFLNGCQEYLGGTILLRGASMELLRKIKDVTEFMVYVLFSLKLESSFFNDNFIHLSKEYYLEEQHNRNNMKPSGYFAEFIEQFDKRLLSVSPSVQFPLPYLLQNARLLERKLLKQKELTSEIQNNEEITKDFLPTISELDITSTLTQNEIKYLVKFIQEKRLEDLELEFHRKRRQWEVSYSLSNNMLGTGTHQGITVLYSMVSKKTATPCIGPKIVTIDYFWESDISLGQFIENVVGTANYPCKQGCDSLLLDHYRSYVHGTGKVDVLVERFQTRIPRLSDVILTWSFCKKCGTPTSILQMSNKTWNFSFGKYLEIMFWSSSEGVGAVGTCTHSFTKDHVKYFAYNDLVVRLEYSDLEVCDLITPPRVIIWKSDKDIKIKVELYYQILDKINLFYESVKERIERIKLDGISVEKQDDVKSLLFEFDDRIEEEKKQLFENLDTLYKTYAGDKHLQLNKVLKAIHDKSILWDADFNTFAQTFLPSETEVSRITSNQLKKFLSPSLKTQSSISLETDNNPKENNIEMQSKSIDNNEQTAPSIEMENMTNFIGTKLDEVVKDEHRNKDCSELVAAHQTDLATFSGNKSHSYGSLPISSENSINNNYAHNKSKSEGNSQIIKSPNQSSADNKVSQLANFFEQLHFDAISKEFELQREFERLQINRNKYRSNKIYKATPVADIYKDVNDAVEEPLRNDKGHSHISDSVKSKRILSNPSISQRTLGQNLENELENSIYLLNEAYSEGYKNDEIENVKEENKNIIDKNSDVKEERESKMEIINPPEKSLLMKTLQTFWADRSASLWKPLVYPLLANEYVFSDNDVIIREDEPSSFIAFCLSTNDYKNKMKYLNDFDLSTLRDNKYLLNTYTESSDKGNHVEPNEKKDVVNESEQSQEEGTEQTDDFKEQNNQLPTESPSEDVGNLETVMTKQTAVHLRYQFEGGDAVMSCKIFFAEQFEAFRRRCGCQGNFIQSLSRCIKWDSSGGKSGSGFLKTLDDRFIIKELTRTELDAFINFAPSYFEYMAQAMFHDLPTTLAKVFGFYQIQVKGATAGSKGYKMDVIIMENLFYKSKTTRIFDLKGSMRNRHVEQTGKENEVLLDENMIEYIYESPIHVREYDKKLLRASLWNDTLFLAKMNVMDYSLVIGINNEDHTLTVGIIDFIRTFTWDKKLESWVKEKGLVSGGSTKMPTVITPKQYKTRFREAMERYILMVPDPWYRQE